MNINPIITRLYTPNNRPENRTTPVNIRPNYRKELQQDSVSFTAAKFSTGLRDSWAKELPRLERIGTAWLDAWEVVAAKTKQYGVSFVREMFESKVVKNPDSQISKANRAKTFERRDLLRTTAFEKNPYDLNILFNQIIPELGLRGNRGYYIAPILTKIEDLIKRGYLPLDEEKLVAEFFEIPHTKSSISKYFEKLDSISYDFPFNHYTRSYASVSDAEKRRYDALKVSRTKYDFTETKQLLMEFANSKRKPTQAEFINIVKSIKKEVPDIDIRLEPEILRKYFDISELPEEFKYCIGEPHGRYEDIQGRTIRDCDKELPSPIYHEFLIHFGPTYNINATLEHQIYESLRQFSELNIDTTGSAFNTPASRVNGYIDSIQKLIRREISEKLYENGKNADFYGMENDINIKVTDGVIEDFNKKFEWLLEELDNHYKGVKKAARKVVSGISYSRLDKDHKADKEIVNKIKQELDEIIKRFNHKYGIQDKG